MADDIVHFVRQRDFVFRRELGQGACGRTVLLYDDMIGEQFVCKKYTPYDEQRRVELFENFKREIKILHLLHHPNIVRVFNYFLYPASYAGYLLMEFIEGSDIEDYLSQTPEAAAGIFRQAIHGFHYLETNGVLHRDIRPGNLLVSADGQLKIIDFGFGKQIAASDDFGKSISLNWWCETPNEFAHSLYDFRTEVYFVGKLFQKILAVSGPEEFEYAQLLSQMCAPDPNERIQSFSLCRRALLTGGISDPEFSSTDIKTYREFATYLHGAISKLEGGTKYLTDADDVLQRLERLYPTVMLEEILPENTVIVRCFLDGAYYYKDSRFPTAVLHRFLTFFRSCSRERRNIVLSNLHAKLDSLARYQELRTEDIPF
jgi:eukaryotic-like serine/threonine-protein kinase